MLVSALELVPVLASEPAVEPYRPLHHRRCRLRHHRCRLRHHRCHPCHPFHLLEEVRVSVLVLAPGLELVSALVSESESEWASGLGLESEPELPHPERNHKARYYYYYPVSGTDHNRAD